MSIKAKLAQVEKLATKFSLSRIKSMSSEQLESLLMQGLEGEAMRAATPQHAAAIRKLASYILSPEGLQNKNASRLLLGVLQNTITERDIPE